MSYSLFKAAAIELFLEMVRLIVSNASLIIEHFKKK